MDPKDFGPELFGTKIFGIKDFSNYLISIFDNLLNNLIQLSSLPISMEILGNYDTKTNQWVLTPKQLYLALQEY